MTLGDLVGVIWKDNQQMLLISTHAMPIGFFCVSVDTILQHYSAI